MSKEIHALKDRTGQIFWPATATDAIIHPQTRLSLTDHIERYNLSDDETILTLEDGINKLVDLGIDQHLGVQMVIKNEDGLIEEWTYFDSNEDFDEPLGWRKGGEIDTTLDATSENPVQNKAVYQAIIDNEEITAAALTELEERTATVETLKADLVNGKVPISQIPELPASLLPTSLDDVLEFEGIENFPSTGSTGIIYVDKETNKLYRWNDTLGNYIQLTTDLDIKSLDQPESSTPLEVGDPYDTAFGKLIKIIRENEIVTAEALQDLNGRLTTSSANLSGKADLVDGKVPASQLPSFVDDVLEYEDLAHFPQEGENGKIYVALDSNLTYRWSGTAYIEISKSIVPYIIDLSNISFGGEDDDSSNGVFEFGGGMHDYYSAPVNNLPAEIDINSIISAIDNKQNIYFTDSRSNTLKNYIVTYSYKDVTSVLLEARTINNNSVYWIDFWYSSENGLLINKGSWLFRKDVNQIKNSIVILPGSVIAGFLDPTAEVEANTYYAMDMGKLTSESASEVVLYTHQELYNILAGSTSYSSDANLIRPVLFFENFDQVTSIIDLAPMHVVSVDFSFYNTSGQNLVLVAEGEEHKYTVEIEKDVTTKPINIITSDKDYSNQEINDLIEEGQKVTSAALCDLDERVLQNKSDIDELEEVTSILSERISQNSSDIEEIVDKGHLQKITWVELRELRDNSELIPGYFYRITDYKCTTTQENTKSADHQFDIVLLALSEDKLAEEGWAMMNESNIYDVTFQGSIYDPKTVKKCYIYCVDVENDQYNIVDCDTLLGISGFNGEGEDFIINETNKTCDASSYSINDLTEPNLTYNYFQNSNLSAWKVWYCLDNDTARFAWAQIGVTNSVQFYNSWTLRTAIYQKEVIISNKTYFVWYSQGPGAPMYILTERRVIERGSNGRYPIAYHTTSSLDSVGSSVISGISNPDTVQEEGHGVIYRLIDEWENDVPYDFKNIQFKRWAITNITSSTLSSDTVQSLNGEFNYNSNGGMHFALKDLYGNWAQDYEDNLSVSIDETISGWYYTFNGILKDENGNFSTYDISTNPLKFTKECLQHIIDSDSDGMDTQDFCFNNKIAPLYKEYFMGEMYIRGRFFLNNIVFNNGPSFCYYNTNEDTFDKQTSHCISNKFGDNCNSNTLAKNCTENTFGNNSTTNLLGSNCKNNIFGYWTMNNIVGPSGTHNIFENQTHSNIVGSYCYSNTFGNYNSRNRINNFCTRNTFEDGCNNNEIGQDSSNNIFKNGCAHITFNGKSYYRYITIESGNRYITLNCTSTTSHTRYYQNVTIAKGTNTTTTRKTISDSNVNQDFQTIYKPANCQEISV